MLLYAIYCIHENMDIRKRELESAAGEAGAFLKILAHPHRLMLVCQLLDGPKSVGELSELIDLRHSTTSQHLSQLRMAGLVAAQRSAQTVFYDLTSDFARDLILTIYNHFCAVPQKKKPSPKKGKAV